MGIEDSTAADGAGRQWLSQDKPVAGYQHDRFGKPEAHKTQRSRLNCFVTVEKHRCHGLGSECVEVNACAMLQRRRGREKAHFNVERIYRRKRPG